MSHPDSTKEYYEDTKEMTKCYECKRKFPDHLISPMYVVNGYTKPICPLCALKIRNETHGLPINEPFTGTMAGEMWEEAKELYPNG